MPLPPAKPLPEDVEYQISRLSAAAADKLLETHKAEAAAREALEKLQDPVVQNETMSQETKRMAEETRRMKVEADINDAQITHVIDVLKTIFKEQSETERSTLAAEVNRQRRRMRCNCDRPNSRPISARPRWPTSSTC